MERIAVDVWLYGTVKEIADTSDAGDGSHANLEVKLTAGDCLEDLMKRISLPTEERGITFINGRLSALPGLQPDLRRVLEDGDRVAFFDQRSMWPFQYRNGAAMDPVLSKSLKGKVFHARPDIDSGP